jgi:hypothetical protein
MVSLGPRNGRGAAEISAGSHRGDGFRLRLSLAVMGTALLAACAAPSTPSPSAALPRDAPVSLAVAGPRPPAGAEFKQLAGFSGTELRRLLGTPDFRRHEAPAEIWQYRGADCVLSLFLYRKSGQYRVAYAEILDRDTVGMSPSSCYDGLLARHPRLHQSRL